MSEASTLPLLTVAPSPVGKGQEDPPTFTKPEALLTAACPDLSPHCFHVHRSFSNFGAQQNLLGSLFLKAQAQASPKKTLHHNQVECEQNMSIFFNVPQ